MQSPDHGGDQAAGSSVPVPVPVAISSIPDAAALAQLEGHEGLAAEGSVAAGELSAVAPAEGQQRAEAAPSSSSDSAVLKMKGLPYSCTETQITEFFKPFEVIRVAWVHEPDGRPSGLAFAEFASKEEALKVRLHMAIGSARKTKSQHQAVADGFKALCKNGDYLGERYVRLLHVPKSEMEEQSRLGTLAIPGAAAKLRSRLMRAHPRGYPLMPGMPGDPLMLSGPLIGTHGMGQGALLASNAAGGLRTLPLGAAGNPGLLAGAAHPAQLAQFAQPQGLDARAWPGYQQGGPMSLAAQFGALSLGAAGGAGGAAGQQLGGHMGQQGNIGLRGGTAMGGPANFSGGTMQLGSVGLAGGLPGGLQMSRTGSSGNRGSSSGPAQGGPVANIGMQGLVPSPGSLTTLGQQQQQQQQGVAGLSSAHALHGQNPGLGAATVAGLQQQAALRVQTAAAMIPSPTSATVKVRGLPYRSSPADILTFFQGYQYLPDSLQIGLDSLGRPSGEAWLTFVTPTEALRSVRDLNRHYLGNRYLELSIC